MGTLLNRRRVMGGGSTAMVEIEYLGKDLRTSSNRGAYIDTGINAKGGTKIILDYSESTRTRHNTWVYGARISSSSLRYGMLFYGTLGDASGQNKRNDTIRRDYNNQNNEIRLNSSDIAASRFFIESDKNKVTINGTTYISSTTVSFDTGYHLYLFALNNGGAVGFDDVYSDAEMYIHSVQIYNDEQLVFDAIPVRVGTTGYMYDKVSGQLFGNSGTGSFTLGPDKT